MELLRDRVVEAQVQLQRPGAGHQQRPAKLPRIGLGKVPQHPLPERLAAALDHELAPRQDDVAAHLRHGPGP
jgi:hypothetical protein